VKLTAIRDGVLYLENVDTLDGSPLLDVKPYVPEFDQPDHVRTGWLARAAEKVKGTKSDGRFRD
jgi:tRNA (Thr-GGU) A37 N-methylase